MEGNMRNWLAKNTLDIPGRSNYPSDKAKGKKCPFCKQTIFTLVTISDPRTKKLKKVCPACGNEIRPST